jgi:hypothetical protein
VNRGAAGIASGNRDLMHPDAVEEMAPLINETLAEGATFVPLTTAKRQICPDLRIFTPSA